MYKNKTKNIYLGEAKYGSKHDCCTQIFYINDFYNTFAADEINQKSV